MAFCAISDFGNWREREREREREIPEAVFVVRFVVLCCCCFTWGGGTFLSVEAERDDNWMYRLMDTRTMGR